MDQRPGRLIARQRQACLQQLRSLAALAADQSEDPFARLLAEGAILHLQADLQWLELCEERLPAMEERRRRLETGG